MEVGGGQGAAGVLGALEVVNVADLCVVAGVEGIDTCVDGDACVEGVVRPVCVGEASCGCMKVLVGVKPCTDALIEDGELRLR